MYKWCHAPCIAAWTGFHLCFQTAESVAFISRSLWRTVTVRRWTYGYLPGNSRYSFSIPLRAWDWVSRGGWLHTKTVYSGTIVHLSTNWAGLIVLMCEYSTWICKIQQACKQRNFIARKRTKNHNALQCYIELLRVYVWMKIYEQRRTPEMLENYWEAAANKRK